LVAAAFVLTAAGVAAPGATAAGTGEFCGPGWQKITTPSVDRYSWFEDVDGVSGDLWAVGSSHGRTGPHSTFAAHWNGSSWGTVPTPDPDPYDELHGVARISPTLAWAVGTRSGANDLTLTIRWNGASWATVPSPNAAGTNELLAVDASGAGDVWAVGRHGAAKTLIEHWDGAAWTILPSPSPGTKVNSLVAVEAVSPTNAWAFGWAVDDDPDGGELARQVLLHWNGVSWSVVPGAPDAPEDWIFTSGSIAPDGDVWTAGGPWGPPPSGLPHGLAQHREGGSWTSWGDGRITSWSGIDALGDADAWLIGSDTRTHTQHWDGTSWTDLAAPPARAVNETLRPRTVFGVSPDEVWALGEWFVAGGAAKPGATSMAMRLCPADVTDSGFSKASSRVHQGSGTVWRFPASNTEAHDVREAAGLAGGQPLFGTGLRPAGTTGTFVLDHAGTFAVVDSATGHTAELTVPTEAAPKKAALGTTFSVFTSAQTSLPSFLGTDIRYRKPGSEFWYRLVSGTRAGTTPFTPDRTGVYTLQARLRSRTTTAFSGWSPFATIKVTAP
jgi:hypothetical protein